MRIIRDLLPFVNVAIALAFTILASSCSTTGRLNPYRLGHIPSEIKPGSSPETVEVLMGAPDARRSVKHDKRGRDVEVWRYVDQWWNGDQIGSWDLFFDKEDGYFGWKLVEPAALSGGDWESDSRGAFYVWPKE